MSALIKHQKQPCPTSCMSTAVAMVAGLPAGTVRRLMHDRYHKGLINLHHMLNELSIPFTSFDTAQDDNARLDMVGAYFCTMPSLNTDGGQHAVVIEITETTWHVLDPNRGKKGRRHYIKGGTRARDGVALGGYSVNAYVCYSWLRDRPND